MRRSAYKHFMLEPIKQSADQRTMARRPIHCKVKVIAPKGQTIKGENFDLSTGGIGMALDWQLAIGDMCSVMFAPFTHGSEKSVSVTASVRLATSNRQDIAHIFHRFIPDFQPICRVLRWHPHVTCYCYQTKEKNNEIP